MKYTVVDLETSGLDFNRETILIEGIGNKQYVTQYGYCYTLPEACTGHNLKFDIKFLNAKIRDNRWTSRYRFDTMLAASVLINRPESLALDSVAKHYLRLESWKDETNKYFKQKKWWEDAKKLAAVADRNAKDLQATALLTDRLIIELEREGSTEFFFKKIMPAARLLTDVEMRGMAIDLKQTENLLNRYRITSGFKVHKLNGWAGKEINWNSPKQILDALKSKNLNPVGYVYDHGTRIEKASSSADALSRLPASPEVDMLREYKKEVKIIAFLEDWLVREYSGRIYPTFNLANTRTGRLSCSEPNLQQVPRDKQIRSLFIAPPGKVLGVIDMAQIEVRVVAHFSQDPTLIAMFNESLDFYGLIAQRVLGYKGAANDLKKENPKLREIAKTIGLSILYGIGSEKLSNSVEAKTGEVLGRDRCKKIIRDYFEGFPGLRKFKDEVARLADVGHVFTTPFGRKFKFSPDEVYMKGVNTLCQSTASDAVLFSQLAFVDDPRGKLVSLVHDEVIYELEPTTAEEFMHDLEKGMCTQPLKVPLKAEWKIGNSWGIK
jgi:DNA polymerase I-like protein with 3'-5' exonuclease and polymerase domains